MQLFLTVSVAVAAILASGAEAGFGTQEDMGEYSILTTPVMNFACRGITADKTSLSETRHILGAYLRRKNQEKVRVTKTRPSIRIVDEDFNGSFCYRIRNAGIAFPTPLDSQNITILTDYPSKQLYYKEYSEMVTPENIAKRAAELQAVLEGAGVTDVSYSKRYVVNFFPGSYGIGFMKT